MDAFLEFVIVKSRLLLVTLLFISILASSFTQATPAKTEGIVHFVSTTGNDANDGSTHENAWRTISHAAQQAQA